MIRWSASVCYDDAVLHVAITITYSPIAEGDIRISGGGKSGLLQYNKGDDDWGAICKYGIDDDAGDIACTQLGYRRSTDIFVYS